MRPGPAARHHTRRAALVVGLLLVPLPLTGQDLSEPAQDATAGAAVFGSKGCVSCHAVRGLGGREGPDLGRIGAARSFHDLTAALWNHVPRVRGRDRGPRPAGMGPREAGDLFAFLYTVDYFHPPGDVDEGRRLFGAKRCVLCHQAEGAGGVIGPNLGFVGQYRSSIPVAAAMWNHGPAMIEEMRARGVERPSFTGRELVDLIAYLEAASEPIASEPMHVVPGVAARGRRLYEAKACARCHGPRGQGGVGPSLVGRATSGGLIDFAAAMWNKAPVMARQMAARGIDLPEMDGADMADIVAYLYSVGYFGEGGSAARGAALLRSKGCAGCHAPGGPEVDLGERRPYRAPATVAAHLWNHVRIEPRNGEAAWPSLTRADAADLTAWLTGGGPR